MKPNTSYTVQKKIVIDIFEDELIKKNTKSLKDNKICDISCLELSHEILCFNQFLVKQMLELFFRFSRPPCQSSERRLRYMSIHVVGG